MSARGMDSFIGGPDYFIFFTISESTVTTVSQINSTVTRASAGVFDWTFGGIGADAEGFQEAFGDIRIMVDSATGPLCWAVSHTSDTVKRVTFFNSGSAATDPNSGVTFIARRMTAVLY